MIVDGICADEALRHIEAFVTGDREWRGYVADLDYDPFEAVRFVLSRAALAKARGEQA